MEENRKIIMVFIAALVLFSAPSLIRWHYLGNPSYIGTPTFMHARISQYIMDGDFDWRDPLSYGGRPYTYPPLFSFCLAFLGLLTGLEAAGIVFVPLFGAAGAVFFYLIARICLKKHALLASVIMIMIPAAIFLNSHISTRAPGVALGLAALYMAMTRKGRRGFLYPGLLTGVSFLFHPEPAAIFLVVIFLYALSAGRPKDFAKIAAVSVAIALAWYGPFLASYGTPEKSQIYDEYREQRYSLESPTLGNYFIEAGRAGMLSLLAAAFCVAGFLCRKDNFLRYWMAFAFLLTLAFERFFIYIPFPLAVLAVSGIECAKKRLGRKIFSAVLIMFVAYTALFGFAKAAAFASDYPTKQQYEALVWIRDNTPENETILSGWQFGHWISGISNRKNFMDGYAEYAPDVGTRLEKLNRFYSSCALPDGIRYVYMEEWFARDRNITCLQGIEPVYSKDYIYVYKLG